ncbi:MAG: histidine phosphatase family protein [Steroidobacteraceae bacterium]
MRRLTLMRHGEARWQDPDTEDFARALSRRGTAGAQAMAARLRELALLPDRVLTSPARRTEQTADIVAQQLDLPARYVLREEPLYLASAAELLKIVQGTGPRITHLMIVAHNPGVSELAQALAPEQEPTQLAAAGLCSIAFETVDWRAIGTAAVSSVCRETPTLRLFGLFS